ncbi:hypothetical protein AB0F52_17590 [Amycolatopsis sp. NPDC024027]|uniref:hypothetical protein n=1 Tax=Amycolatopsis sp. NPDC024027 TaxID=3154327 RepID=UPI0033F68BD4
MAFIRPGLGYYALLLRLFPSTISRRVQRRRPQPAWGRRSGGALDPPAPPAW